MKVMMKVIIAVVVTDRRKVSVQDKATAAQVDSESDEHFPRQEKKIIWAAVAHNMLRTFL